MFLSITVLVLLLTLAAFCFRRKCTSILRAKPDKDYATIVAADNRLKFPELGRALPDAHERRDLDLIESHLRRDYELVTYILEHGAAFRFGSGAHERRLLKLDFTLMRLYYGISRRLHLLNSQTALRRMISILKHFAQSMGEHRLVSAD